MIKPIYRIIKKLNLNIPIITVVTDPYVAPALWFLNKNQNFIVFSETLKNYCVKKGINPDNINTFNFVIDEKYSKRMTKDEINIIKKDFGFKKKNILLILGGGDGIPNGINIIKNVLKSKSDFEIALVCGNNKELFEKANKIKVLGKYDNLKIYGYVNFIYELISISDIVISKCGASTFTELLISHKLQIINTYLWEQEKGNVEFLVKNNLGIFEKKINRLPHIIDDMFKNNGALAKYKTNIMEFNYKNGLPEVAQYLLKN